ncbi:MAG: hypothetical protein ACTS73_08630 [Arsenophonus sp. NEOnobi-MAG3]
MCLVYDSTKKDSNVPSYNQVGGHNNDLQSLPISNAATASWRGYYAKIAGGNYLDLLGYNSEEVTE